MAGLVLAIRVLLALTVSCACCAANAWKSHDDKPRLSLPIRNGSVACA
jgi:hypothetical protein